MYVPARLGMNLRSCHGQCSVIYRSFGRSGVSSIEHRPPGHALPSGTIPSSLVPSGSVGLSFPDPSFPRTYPGGRTSASQLVYMSW